MLPGANDGISSVAPGAGKIAGLRNEWHRSAGISGKRARRAGHPLLQWIDGPQDCVLPGLSICGHSHLFTKGLYNRVERYVGINRCTGADTRPIQHLPEHRLLTVQCEVIEDDHFCQSFDTVCEGT